MFKNWNRYLAFLLSIALVFTTFGSDFASVKVFATEDEMVEAPAEGGDAQVSEDSSSEETPEESGESEDGGSSEDEAPAEEYVETEEPASEELEVVADGEVIDENAEAAQEELLPEGEKELTEEEKAAKEKEEAEKEAAEKEAAEKKSADKAENFITVTYEATEGGEVSLSSEKIDLNDEDAAFEGSEATAADGYEFKGWKDEDGETVCTDAHFTPSGIEKDATFTAEFAAAEELEPEKEEKFVTVTYKPTKGGKVSLDKEKIDINAKDAAFEGSEATAWNDKYEFVGWKDEEGNTVCSEAIFVPSDIKEDATFTAEFVAVENIEDLMPKLSESTSTGGMHVSVEAEVGVFPKGTTVTISAISDDQALSTAQEAMPEATVAKGVDITFQDEEGHEIQPASDKYVHVSIALEEAIEGENFAVIHDHGDSVEKIDADISTEEVNRSSEDETKAVTDVSFDSGEFSIFIIAVEDNDEEVLRMVETYVFKVYNTTTRTWDTISEQAVKNGETLNNPGIPDLTKDQKYYGWFYDAAELTDEVEFGPKDNITATRTVVVKAKIVTTYHIVLKGVDDEVVDVLEKEVVNEGDTLITVNATVTPKLSTQAFDGWKNTKGIVYQNGTEVDSSNADNNTLTANIVNAYWIHFHENDGEDGGASYTPPIYVTQKTNYKATKPTDPTRSGYRFDKWYTDPGCTNEFSWNTAISENIELYAKWIGSTAPFTINIWRQRTTGDQYDYYSCETVSNKNAGTTITSDMLGNAIKMHTNQATKEAFKGFNYKRYEVINKKASDGQKIAYDGSTVVNVYYDRIEYTLTFKDGNKTAATITERYGAYIADRFPFRGYEDDRWDPQGSSTFSYVLVVIDTMPAENITFKKSTRQNHTQHMNFYVESLPGGTVDKTYEGKNYTKYRDEITVHYNFITEAEDFITLTGFTKYKSNPKFYNGVALYYKDGNIDFYYTRNNYNFTILGKTGNSSQIKQLGVVSIPYQAQISGYSSSYQAFITAAESQAPAGYSMKKDENGNCLWADEAGSSIFDLNTTMPASNDTRAYIVWEKDKYEVNLDLNEDGDENPATVVDPSSIEIKNSQSLTWHPYYGEVISSEAITRNFARPGYELVGWFDYDTHKAYGYGMITGDVNLYAKWRRVGVVKVVYDVTDANGVTGYLPDSQRDNADYAGSSNVVVTVGPKNDTIVDTDGKKGYTFVEWELLSADNSTVVATYYPGASFEIKDSYIQSVAGVNEVHLRAKYVKTGIDDDYYTTITYHPGTGTGDTTTISEIGEGENKHHLRVNEAIVAWTLADAQAHNFNKPYCELIGWDTDQATAAAGTARIPLGTEYIIADNDSAASDNTDANTLYAVWKQKTATYTIEYYKGSYDNLVDTLVDQGPENVGTQLYLTDAQLAYGKTSGLVGAGYKDGVQDPKPCTIQESGNVIRVLYEQIPVTVKIKGTRTTKTFNNEYQYAIGYTVESISYSGYTAEDFSFVGIEGVEQVGGKPAAKGKAAGTYAMGLTPECFQNDNLGFDNVTFVIELDGQLIISPIDVTVTIVGANNTTDFDGEAHSVTGYTATANSNLYDVDNDFTFSGEATATRTDAGTTNMGLAESQFTNTNANYDVTFSITDGYQKINKIGVTVTITGHHHEDTYDGEEHSISGYEVEFSNSLYTEADFTFSGTAEAKRTDVGTTGMGLAASQFTNTNQNFTGVVFQIDADGYQRIVPVNAVVVTITGHKNTCDYDGQEHGVSGYDVQISNPLYTEAYFTFSGTAEAKRTAAGTTNMGLDKTQFENTNDNFVNVIFNVTDGYQTINKINVTVTITGATNETDYDGESHSVSGYGVEIGNPLYTEADFTFSGTDSATRTDAGTTYMGLAEGQFTNTNANFGTVTFNVTDGYQKINPIDITVTITGANNETDYDGAEHGVSGYGVVISNPLYTEADFTFSGTAEAKRTNAGTTYMGLADTQFENTNDNFATVTFNVTDGYQKINPINVTVTITGANNEADYDGEEHSVSGYTAVADNDLYDVDHDFTFSGTAEAKRTDAGTTYMGLAKEQFENTNSNFETVTFNVTDGYQKIKPIAVTVTITGANNTTDYDGQEHGVSGYGVEISNSLYTEADFTFSGTAEAKRTDAGTTNMGLAEDQFENTNPNFEGVTFDVTDGYQKINKISVTVTITGANNTATYDGAEHSVSGYDVEISNSLYTEDDFTFSGTAEAKRTDVGKTDMGLAEDQFANTNENFENVTFAVTDGYQAITPLNTVVVTITGHKNTTDYDGEEHGVSGYDVEISDPLYTEADFTFSGNQEAKRTDAGTTYMGLAENQFENTNENFSSVTFSVTDGYQKIDPINITVTITGHNDTKDYDGQEHGVSGYDVEISNPLYTEADFTFSGNQEAKRTDAGTTYMGLASDQFTNNNGNFAKVDFVIAADGYQKIDPIDVTVTITGHNDTTDYDGQEHGVSGYDVEISDPLYTEADFTFSGTAQAKRTDAGTTYMGLAAGQFENTNDNFNVVTFDVKDGFQKIDPIDVTVTIKGHNNEADYDGEEHVVSGYDVTIENPLYTEDDFTFSGTAEAKRTDAGTTDMGLAAGQFTNTNDNFKVVTFDVKDGFQKINPIDITVTITGHTSELPYDGNEHSISGYEVGIENTLYKEEDFTFSGSAEAKRTDAGTTNMGLAASQFANTNNNFATVTFDVTDGYQKINPIDVTVVITGHHNTATFDNKEHSVSGYDVEIVNPLYTEADFTFGGTAYAARTNEGTTYMGLAASQFVNNNDNFATVTFDVTDGYQKITPVDVVEVTIIGHHTTHAYDGTEYTASGYDVEISNPLYTEADFTFSGTAEAARTEAGKSGMNLAADQFKNTNGNFETVTFNVTDGYVEITPIDIEVTIVGDSVETDYDGNKHEASGYTITSISNPLFKESDVQFHADSYRAYAERTVVGTTNMGLEPVSFFTVNKNFANVTFNVTDGFVTIKPIDVTVTITGANNTTDYDGDEHSVSGYTVSISNPLYTEADFTFSGTAAAARTDAGTTNMNLAADQFKNKNNNFGTVTFNVTDGYQTINKINAEVTITGANNTTDYDGTEHSVSGYTATANTALYNVETDFTFSGNDQAARTDAGTTNMGLAADQFANTNANFETVTFKVTDGYQKINKINAEVTIVGANNSTAYDGKEHSVEGFTATANTALYDVEKDFTFSGTAEAARTNAGTTNMGLAADQFTNTNSNFATVTFNVTDGYQTINKIDAEVTIIGANNTAVYDSTEHSVSGYTATANTDLYDVDKDFTFSGTAYAARTEVGSTEMGLAADQFTNKNENFGTVTFNVTDGFQAITPVDEVVVTITGRSTTHDYDGTEYTASGYDVEISNPLYTTSNFTFSGTAEAARTDAGTTNMGLAESQFTNNSENFKKVSFVVTDGFVTINPINVTVTVTGANNTADYDGEKHSVSGYTAVASTPLYNVETDFTFSGNDKAERTDAGTTNMGLAAPQFINKNENFKNVTFNITDGYQTINPIDVTVTIVGNNKTADYNGKSHEAKDYTATANTELYNVKKDIAFTGTALAARTDVGTTNMGLAADQFSNKNENFGSVSFEVTDGYVTINPIDVEVTIVGKNNTTSYDGAEHSVTGYTATATSPLYDVEKDFTFSGSAAAARTDAGTTKMGLAAEQFKNANTNFGNVTFIVTDGFQQIDPIDVEVTIVGNNNTTVYDGAEHSVSDYTATAGSELYDVNNDFTFSGKAYAARTDVGTTNMELAAEQFKNINENFANVTFNVTDGYQTIEPVKEVTVYITGNTLEEDYDGKLHTVSDYKAEADNALYDVTKDFSFSGLATASRTDAGITYMGLTPAQFTNTNENFATVTFIVTDGYVAVGKIDAIVTIIGNNSTDPYNGKVQKVKDFTAESNTELFDVKKDMKFTGKAEASRTDVGTEYMNLSPSQFESTNLNFKNVVFEVTDGYQTITPLAVKVVVTGNHDTFKYNGKEQRVEGYDLKIENGESAGEGPDASKIYKKDYINFSGKAEAKGKLPNTYYMNMKAGQFKNTNDNFTVTFDVTDGYLVINNLEEGEKFYIESATDDVTITYDGNTHTGSEFGYRLTGGKEKSSFLQRVGEVVEDIGEAISNLLGAITSHAAEGDNGSGKTVTIDGVNFTVTGLSVDVSAKNVGSYQLPVTGSMTVLDEDGNDVTPQFKAYAYPESQTKIGTLTIEPAEVTVKAENATKVRGTADPEFKASVTPANQALYDEANATVQYTLTRETGENVGVEYAIIPVANEYQGNFKVIRENGILTITAPAPTPTPTPGGDVTPDPDPTPGGTPTNIPDAPVPMAPAPQGAVLGAQREAEGGNGAAVLGARRGRTDDPANSASRIFAILMAAAVAISMLVTGRKKEEEEKKEEG